MRMRMVRMMMTRVMMRMMRMTVLDDGSRRPGDCLQS